MAKLAFLGLGQMGAPMAHRLIEADHEVTVWNRTAAKAEALVDAGARLAASPAEAARDAEAVLTMLATPEALEQVLFANDGVAAGLGRDTTLIEMSTVGPEAVAGVAERLGDGIEVVDAPVLGSVPQAIEGKLQVFVGGTESAYQRWAPVLRALGEPRHVGALGAGAAMKLVANSTIAAMMTALGEALSLGDALGLEEKVVLDILAQSAIGATVTSKRDKIETDTYDPNFKLELAAKDMALVTEAARTAGLELKVAEAARAWFEAATAAGVGEDDYSAVVAHVRGRPARP